MSKFNIGDEVIVTRSNESGVITDRMYSEAKCHFMYVIKPHEGGRSIVRSEHEIEPYYGEVEYRIETQVAENVVIGIIYEIRNGYETEVCRGHGHIIHEGAEGIAQACAYAYKKAFSHIDSGIYYKQRQDQ